MFRDVVERLRSMLGFVGSFCHFHQVRSIFFACLFDESGKSAVLVEQQHTRFIEFNQATAFEDLIKQRIIRIGISQNKKDQPTV